MFFVEDLEAFCCRLTCFGSFVCGFKFLSMPTMRPTFNSLLAVLLPAPSTLAPPSSGDSVAVSTVASGASNSLSNVIASAMVAATSPSSEAQIHRECSHLCLCFPPFLPPCDQAFVVGLGSYLVEVEDILTWTEASTKWCLVLPIPIAGLT